MPELAKATLEEVSADKDPKSLGDPIPVQLNPSSLKLSLKNTSEGGRSQGRQRSQQTGTSSTTLSMELVFDSADETAASGNGPPEPVSVRHKTALVEKFVLPKKGGSETPPRIRFKWHELELVGIVEGLDIDFDLFAPNGAPLRAKMQLTIKEQDPKYEFLEYGPGAREGGADTGDPEPGAGTNDDAGAEAPGDRTTQALEGETPADLAARNGLDPRAWRGLDLPTGIGLSLSAGLEVGFSAGLSLSAGIGLSAGFEAGIGVSLETSLGIDAGIGAGAGIGGAAGASAGTQAGLALSAAGGVADAIEQAKLGHQQQAAAAARAAFPSPAAAGQSTAATSAAASASARAAGAVATTAAPPARATSTLTPLGAEPERERISRPPAASAPPPPLADPRAYGTGIPLRPLVRTTIDARRPRLCGTER